MKPLALGLILFILVTFSACGGSMGTTNNPPPPPPPTVVNANVTIDSTTSGPFDVAMSTSFQPAEWDYTFFQQFPNATTPLGNLQPHHIRLQTVSQGVPQSAASTWDFSVLDAITQPVLTVGDHSPEMQLGWAPTFMWSNGSQYGTLDVQAFTGYTQNMVRYYNTAAGFTVNGQTYKSPSQSPITWWGILNEPSINGFTGASAAADYTSVYNSVVPAMQAVDPNIKFVALELCCGTENWAQTFAQNVAPGVPVDAVATHYYSICAPATDYTDAQVFSTVPGFATSVQSIYGYLAANASLSNVPVWITENNVNADFDSGGGVSACTGKTYVRDDRGSSAFFAAWRPYVFSQVGKAGAQALYHWDFGADAQFGEMNWSNSGLQYQLSYWVDYWLGQMFPAGSGQLLQSTNSDVADIEVLPVIDPNTGSVVIMISNHAVASPADNNGAGLTADVAIDTSALGPFASASEVVIDSSTSVTTGPTPANISPTSPIKLSMNGYSVAFIKLQ